MIRKEQLYEQILEQIDLTKETDDEELQELIRTVLDEAADEEYISLSDKIRIGRELFNSFRKLDVLQELLEDDSITEIMVNGIDHIFYEKEGRIFRSKKCFLSQERLLDVIQQIVGESNRYVNEASPIVDPLAVVNNLSDFIFSLIRAIGLILLGFGVVQIGLSLKSHDPSQRANGFLTLAGGVIITFAKEILDLIMV